MHRDTGQTVTYYPAGGGSAAGGWRVDSTSSDSTDLHLPVINGSQLKSGDSHLRLRQTDGKLIFDVQNPRHLDYWQSQPCDVWLVLRDGHGTILWMNITQYLRDRPNKTCLQIEFDGSPLTASAIRLLG